MAGTGAGLYCAKWLLRWAGWHGTQYPSSGIGVDILEEDTTLRQERKNLLAYSGSEALVSMAPVFSPMTCFSTLPSPYWQWIVKEDGSPRWTACISSQATCSLTLYSSSLSWISSPARPVVITTGIPGAVPMGAAAKAGCAGLAAGACGIAAALAAGCSSAGAAASSAPAGLPADSAAEISGALSATVAASCTSSAAGCSWLWPSKPGCSFATWLRVLRSEEKEPRPLCVAVAHSSAVHFSSAALSSSWLLSSAGFSAALAVSSGALPALAVFGASSVSAWAESISSTSMVTAGTVSAFSSSGSSLPSFCSKKMEGSLPAPAAAFFLVVVLVLVVLRFSAGWASPSAGAASSWSALFLVRVLVVRVLVFTAPSAAVFLLLAGFASGAASSAVCVSCTCRSRASAGASCFSCAVRALLLAEVTLEVASALIFLAMGVFP